MQGCVTSSKQNVRENQENKHIKRTVDSSIDLLYRMKPGTLVTVGPSIILVIAVMNNHVVALSTAWRDEGGYVGSYEIELLWHLAAKIIT